MRITKEERLRREAMSHALSIVKDEGIEGLEKRLARSEISNAPVFMSDQQYKTYHSAVVEGTYRIVLATALLALDGVGFEQLPEFAERFAEEFDTIYGGWNSFEDTVEYYKDERGIDIEEYVQRAVAILDETEGKLEDRKDFVGVKKDYQRRK